MKPSFSLILSLLLCLCVNSIIQVNADCWDHPNPLKPWEKIKSQNCGTQEKKKLDDLDSLSGQPAVVTPDNAFQFNFSCIVTDQSLCAKAENSFKKAGSVIASLIKFNTPLTVNATFANFCQVLGECGGNILGAASAARTISLLDDDNIVRQYPQALAKQFLLNPQPQWGPFDIQAFFNAEAPLFFGDGNILATQFDFEYIIMHELIHGLGFASGWNNYFSDQPVSLTPDPGFLEQLTSLTSPVKYTGFEQTAFDKYMVNAKDTTKSPIRMSDLAVEMNGFAPIGTDFPNVQNLLDTFASSDQFQLSKSLIGDSQISKTFAFQPQNAASTDDLVFLETNLNPFQQGSSISHMDAKSFTGTPDFLEVFNAVRGKSLDQVLQASSGKFPIGPKLQSVLETLGYTTDNNPNPYKPKLPDSQQGQPNVPAPLPVGNNSTSSDGAGAGGAGDGYGTGAGTGTGTGTGTGAAGGNVDAATVMDKSTLDEKDSAAVSLTSSFNILSVFIVVTATLLF